MKIFLILIGFERSSLTMEAPDVRTWWRILDGTATSITQSSTTFNQMIA